MTALLLVCALQTTDLKPVRFEYAAPEGATSVSVAGTFNGWDKTSNQMVSASAGNWNTVIDIPIGKHHYKFVVNGEQWVTDPRAAKNEDDGNGNINSVLLVPPNGYETPAIPGDREVTGSALRHVQELPFLNWDQGQLTVTLRARRDDLRAVAVHFETGTKSGWTALKQRGSDELFTFWSGRFPWDRKNPVKYSFALEQDGSAGMYDQSVHWLQIAVDPDGPEHRFVLDNKTFRPIQPPNWVEKSVIYQIFPDRFENGDRSNDPSGVVAWGADPTYWNWFGGDLAGVKKRLNHLVGLGVGCVYFNPVFEGPSNHRYETTDYLKIDHRLGTNEEFAALVADMKRQGVKTVLDGVFNHTSTEFHAFKDLLASQHQSEFLDWYTVKSFPVQVKEDPSYEAWFGFPSMPKLNMNNPGPRKTVLDAVDFWEKKAGIDGWRLDVANEVPMDFWKEFRTKVKSHGSGRWIVGEIWGDGSPWLKGDQFDSVMNYQFREAALGFVARRTLEPTQFWERLIRVHEAYGPQVSRNMMNLLSSHDTPRILTECGGDPQLARLAAMLQFTWIGAPCVYYGDELGMAGGRDPENRRGMEWSKNTRDNPFKQLYVRLADMRKGSASLQSGEPVLVGADDERDLLVFRRRAVDQWNIVGVNRSGIAQNAVLGTNLNLVAEIFENGPDSISFEQKTVSPKNGTVSIDIPPLSIAVLRPAIQSR